jgi:hypothetical protein
MVAFLRINTVKIPHLHSNRVKIRLIRVNEKLNHVYKTVKNLNLCHEQEQIHRFDFNDASVAHRYNLGAGSMDKEIIEYQ